MKLNHIGYVVKDVESEVEIYKSMGFSASELLINETQKVKEVFVDQNTDVKIELLEPLDESSPVYNFLKANGGGVHHLCYEIDEPIEEFLSRQRSERAVILCPPTADIAFAGRIAFYFKHGRVFEVVESLPPKR